MKLILKKYMMPIILSIITIVLLTLLRLIKQTSFSINELSLWGIIIANTLVIRTIDDLFDYQDDLKNNKKVIPLKIQCLLFVIFAITSVVLSVFISGLFGLIISIAYLLFIAISFRQLTSLKIFIYPFHLFLSFMMLLNIYQNTFNNIFSYIYIIVVVIIVLVTSMIYGVIKRGKKYETIHNN